MTTKYFDVKKGITTGNITLDAATGNILGVSNANLGNLVIANYFSGAGNLLSNIQGANVSGAVANANYAAFAGQVVDATQANITAVGTLTSLSVSGNLSAGNANLGNLATANFFQGDGGLLTNVAASGTLANGTSNVSIPAVNGNVNTSVGGVANVFVVTTTGANVTGTLSASGNANVNNLGTGIILASGNITGNNISSNNELSSATLSVSGNAIANNITSNANISGVTITATGNLSGNNVSATNTISGVDLTLTGNANANVFNGNTLSITGNANVGNLNTSGTVSAGNVTATGNIDTTSGAVNAANIFANTITANVTLTANSANITNTLKAANLEANALTAISTSDLYLYAGTGNANIILTPTGNGTVSVSSKRIIDLAAPTGDNDAATKKYVDDIAQGLNIHDACYAATANTLANLTGGTITYNNGTAGVGATLTLSGSPTKNFTDANTFDGNVTAVATNRILVKSEANAAHNGIYVVTSSTVLTRATDYDTVPEVEAGDFTFVQNGDTYNDTGWVQTSTVTTIGTDPIEFTQFSGAGTYSAGAGLTLTGTVFSVNVDNVTTAIVSGNVVVKANAEFITPNIGAATGTSLDLTGNSTVNNLTVNLSLGGNTANFSGNISAANGNLGNLVTANFVTGTLTTNAQPNVTSVGTLTSLDVSGNVVAGNVYANSGTIGANLLTGTLTTNAQPNVTSLGTLTGLTVNGTSNLGPNSNVIITGGSNGQFLSTDGAGNLSWATASTSGISNGTSNVNIPAANGNVNISSNGTANVLVVSDVGANVTGNLGVSGNISVASITVTGNIGNANVITANSFVGNVAGPLANGTSNVAIPTSNGNVNITANGTTTLVVTDTGANITGTLSASGNANVGNLSATDVTATTLGGSLTTASQPNVTSVGTLSNLAATGNVNFTGAGNVALGNVGNVKIGGGSASQYLQTDGTGNLTWATVDTDTLANGTSNVDIPVANGNINMSVGGNANIVVVTGTGANVTGTFGVSGNANVGNLGVTGVFATTLSATGNANVGNIGATAGAFTGNVTAGNVKLDVGLTSNRSNVSVTGSATVIDQFVPTTFRTAKYIISASGDDGYQSIETLLVHDGSNSYITIYGSICSNNSADLIDITSNINGTSGNVSLYATSASANTLVNIVATYIKT